MMWHPDSISAHLDGQVNLSFRQKRNTQRLARHMTSTHKKLTMPVLRKIEHKDRLDADRYWTSLCWLLLNGYAQTTPGKDGTIVYSLRKGVIA